MLKAPRVVPGDPQEHDLQSFSLTVFPHTVRSAWALIPEKHLTKTPNPTLVTSLCAWLSLGGSDNAPLPLAATEGKAKQEKTCAWLPPPTAPTTHSKLQAAPRPLWDIPAVGYCHCSKLETPQLRGCQRPTVGADWISEVNRAQKSELTQIKVLNRVNLSVTWSLQTNERKGKGVKGMLADT